MQTIELNKKVSSIEVQDDKIIINLEQEYTPKDGEYFYVKPQSTREYIAIEKEGEDITHSYVNLNLNSKDLYWSNSVCNDNFIVELRPATKEERELLDKALEEKGKRWNPETKQIEELPKVGDFCIFWNNYKEYAVCSELISINKIRGRYYTVWESYSNCIPFQSAEHFKGFIKK